MLALIVQTAARNHHIKVGIKKIENPRVEKGRHYYNPSNQSLLKLGYEPTPSINGEISKLIQYLYRFKDNVKEDVIMPTTKWR